MARLSLYRDYKQHYIAILSVNSLSLKMLWAEKAIAALRSRDGDRNERKTRRRSVDRYSDDMHVTNAFFLCSACYTWLTSTEKGLDICAVVSLFNVNKIYYHCTIHTDPPSPFTSPYLYASVKEWHTYIQYTLLQLSYQGSIDLKTHVWCYKHSEKDSFQRWDVLFSLEIKPWQSETCKS